MASILVGIPTYNKERYALIPLLKGLQMQTSQDFEVLMVDNSPDEAYAIVLEQALQAAFPGRGRVVHVESDERYSNILRSREKIRDEFLKGKWTHLFLLDSDVILPRTALERLMKADVPLATGVYLNALKVGDRLEVRPCLYLDAGKDVGRLATIPEVLKEETLLIGAAGLGCTLVSRAVVKKIGFRRNEGTEDAPFYRDAIKKLSLSPMAVCSVKCLHLHFPLGDQRNKPFDLSRYRLESNKKAS